MADDLPRRRLRRWGSSSCVGGLVLVPLPGPGWLIVILGIAVWASEFEPAARLLDFVKAKVRAWEEWLRPQAVVGQGARGARDRLVVACALWLVMQVSGVPGFLPDGITAWLEANAGL